MAITRRAPRQRKTSPARQRPSTRHRPDLFGEPRFEIGRRLPFQMSGGRPPSASKPFELPHEGAAVPTHRKMHLHSNPSRQRRAGELSARHERRHVPARHHLLDVQPFRSRHSRNLVRAR